MGAYLRRTGRTLRWSPGSAMWLKATVLSQGFDFLVSMGAGVVGHGPGGGIVGGATAISVLCGGMVGHAASSPPSSPPIGIRAREF